MQRKTWGIKFDRDKGHESSNATQSYIGKVLFTKLA